MNFENKNQSKPIPSINSEHHSINPFVEQIIQRIVENNPYGFILRPDLKEKTGGLLHGRTMANLDSLGTGIKNRFRVGHVTAYPVDSIVEFIKGRITVASDSNRNN